AVVNSLKKSPYSTASGSLTSGIGQAFERMIGSLLQRAARQNGAELLEGRKALPFDFVLSGKRKIAIEVMGGRRIWSDKVASFVGLVATSSYEDYILVASNGLT